MIFYPRQNRRWDKDYLYAKKIFEEQIIGNIFDLECRITGSRGIPGDWRAKKAFGGGMMLDWGVHQLDRLLDMVKEPVKTVFCRLEYATHKECEDGFKMQLIFESGLKASVQVGTCHFVRHPNWYLAGEQGTAIIEDWNCNGKIVRLRSWKDADATPIVAGEGLTKTMAPRGDNSVETLPLPDLHYDRNELYANFAACIRGEAQQIVTGEQALRVIRLMEAAVHSHNTCAAVDFE